MKKALKKISTLKKSVHYLKSHFPNHFLYTKEFWKWYNFLQESQWWSEERLVEYQWSQLKLLLVHCYENVPYYKNMFRELNATPNDIKTQKDFEKIPFLTKNIVYERLDDLLPKNIDKNKLNYFTTGGSSGEPLGFYKDKMSSLIESAFMFAQWGRVGYKPGDLRMILRGEVVPRRKLFSFQSLSKSWLFSSFHLSPRYITVLVNKLNSIKPKFLHVYPSSLWVFTNLMIENNLKLSFSLKAILCGSETLYPYQRKLFEKVFKCRVYSWLGLAEGVILAGECEKSSNLHILSEYSYVELIDKNENIIKDERKSGEIVGTNFKNFITPFIRYKSGDIASFAHGKCECGRNYALLKKIDGRIQNMIILKDGKIIPLTALIFGQHFIAFDKIKKMQIEQKQVGKVTIRLIKGLNFTIADEKEMKKVIAKATNNSISVDFEYVSTIPRTQRGKHKFLIQHIPIKYYN